MSMNTEKENFLRHVRGVTGDALATLYGRAVRYMDEEELRAAVAWLGARYKEELGRGGGLLWRPRAPEGAL